MQLEAFIHFTRLFIREYLPEAHMPSPDKLSALTHCFQIDLLLLGDFGLVYLSKFVFSVGAPQE